MYDREKLELMYFLTQNNKFMNHAEIARTFGKTKDLSERTVRRWLKQLQKYRFDYWPALHYHNFNLRWVCVTVENLRDCRFLKAHPYLVYIFSGTNLQNFAKTLVLGYLIPQKNLPDFKAFLAEAKNKNIFDTSFSFAVKTAIPYAYAPFNKIIMQDGNFQFSEDYGTDFFINKIAEIINRKSNPEVLKQIRKNPLIVPILFEYLREHWSSRRVWFNAKNKLGPKIWDYVHKIKKRKHRQDSIGIRLVQEATRQINQNSDMFFLQTKVDYVPFHYKAVVLQIFLKLKDASHLLKFCESIAKNALMSAFCIGENNDKLLGLYIMTNSDKMNHIVCNLLPHNVDPKFKTKIVCLNLDEYNSYYSKARHYMKFDYSKVFDPKKCAWIYEHGKYVAELKRL